MPALLLVFVFCAHSAARAATPPVPAAGTIASLAGKARIRRSGSALSSEAAANAPIYPTDTIETGAASTVKILFRDNTIVDVGPESLFRVEQFQGSAADDRNALLSLIYGRIRALVTKTVSGEANVRIRTPSSLMGVRGTELVVQVPPAEQGAHKGAASASTLTVLSGSVSARAFGPGGQLGEAVLVAVGQQLKLASGPSAVLKPIQLAPTQLKGLAAAAKMKDNTFDRTITVEAGAGNETRPTAATSLGLTRDAVSVATAALKEGESAAPLDAKPPGVFGALDVLTDAPAQILPGNLKAVKVTLQ